MAAENSLPEITIKVVVLSTILAIILAASNTYLALKIGILTTASIPAAVLSMGILRLFKSASILENNLVQTAASAGEAVAGGIVYTIPALIIIHFWKHFAYWENFLIAFCGGILGILFSIPLRRVLMKEKDLNFPEGKAIAEVLLIGAKKTIGLREMLLGGFVGAAIEVAQNGFKIIANNIQLWFLQGQVLFGVGAGFSATLIGAGYLIGFNVGVSLIIGAFIGWMVLIPLLSFFSGQGIDTHHAAQMVMGLWNEKIRYVGIGAMLTAGIWTLLNLLKPFYESLQTSVKALASISIHDGFKNVIRTEQDIPFIYVLYGIGFIAVLLFFLFQHLFNIDALGLCYLFHKPFLLVSLLYVLIIGFIFAAICAYFSGLVGVSASPGSAIMIGSLLLAALLLRALLEIPNSMDLTHIQLTNAAAITIIIGSVIMGAAALADNIQVLKVGHIVGATPWKQQIMLMLGVMIAAIVVPAVMELLFNVYGISDVFPRSGMDHQQVLPAPPAAMMAAITQGIFNHQLPWDMLVLGMGITLLSIAINYLLNKKGWGFSVLGLSMGIYLPLSSTTPLFLGSLFALLVKKSLDKKYNKDRLAIGRHQQYGLLLACGLVSGAALMDVILAIPFAIVKNPNVMNIMPEHLAWLSKILGILVILLLGLWFPHVACKSRKQ